MKLYVPGEGISPRELSLSGEEVWAPCSVGKSLFVSNLGKVMRESTVLDLAQHAHGYFMLHVTDYGPAYVHALVLSSFEGLSPEHTIGHSNGDKLDNRLCNLQERSTGRKLTEESKWAITRMLLQGRRVKDVAENFGISPAHVSYYKKKAEALLSRGSPVIWTSLVPRDVLSAMGEESLYQDYLLALSEGKVARVYLLSDGDFYKIGRSRNLKGRLSQIQTANAQKISLLSCFRGGKAEETKAQREFEGFRVRGEWYAKSPKILEFFRHRETSLHKALSLSDYVEARLRKN